MLIKICGLTRPEDAAAAVAAGADLLGFIFVPGTPRALDPERDSWVREVVGGEKVGVFRDAPLDRVLAVRDALGLDRVQLHGDEPDAFLDRLGAKTLRRVQPRRSMVWARIAELGRRCLPLLDPGAGDGVAWAWEELAGRPSGIAVGLAGGLTPENVAEAMRLVRPALVDVSSGVETAPGIKDPTKVRNFVTNARTSGC
ncbi:MAG: phosphoribosylanthranilate isomerase [Thermoanaerobaculales bacterium]